MKKSKKRKIGDSGIRLKPNESNILENYTKYRKRSRKKKKRKPKRKSKKIKNVEILEKKDPLLQIVEESQNKNKEEIVVEEIEEDNNKKEELKQTKTIHVDNKPQDLSEKDPNVTKKTLTITASLKPEKSKEGGGILLE
tara:strand:- start:98 stop:514 length:417 start_codon:yes stop_codon:yes gene_type:complete